MHVLVLNRMGGRREWYRSERVIDQLDQALVSAQPQCTARLAVNRSDGGAQAGNGIAARSVCLKELVVARNPHRTVWRCGERIPHLRV